MKYFIYYNNGHCELTDKFNETIKHMLEIGVIKVVADLVNKKAWINIDGDATEINITEITNVYT
jgi:hypothetical protein